MALMCVLAQNLPTIAVGNVTSKCIAIATVTQTVVEQQQSVFSVHGGTAMELVSVNRSTPVTIRFNGTNVSTGIYKMPIQGAVNVTQFGLEGDAIVDKTVHGGLDQAIYLYHKEDYDWWSALLGRKIENGTFGENFTISGSDDISWIIGDRIRIAQVILEITAPRTPCFKLGVRMGDSRFVKQFADANRPGAYARVINNGTVSVGDQLEIDKTTKPYVAVKEIFAEWHSAKKSLDTLTKALDSPIATVHKAKIQNWYDELIKQQI